MPRGRVRPRDENGDVLQPRTAVTPQRTPDPTITRDKAEEAFDKIVMPFFPDLVERHLHQAMGDDALALKARIDILNRGMGLPTQRVDVKEDKNITLIFRPVSSLEEAKDVSGLLGDVIEGESREIINLQLEAGSDDGEDDVSASD